MPRRVRNPGSGKPPCNMPASGMAASGLPARGGPPSGIPANGSGYGGPARGSNPFSTEYQPGAGAQGTGRQQASLVREYLTPRLQKITDTLLHNLDDENPFIRNAAAIHLMERVVGKVPQSPAEESSDGRIGVIIVPPKGSVPD